MLQHFSELIDKVKAMPRTVVCVANADSGSRAHGSG